MTGCGRCGITISASRWVDPTGNHAASTVPMRRDGGLYHAGLVNLDGNSIPGF